MEFGTMTDTSPAEGQQQKKKPVEMAGTAQPAPTASSSSSMVTAIHGPAEAIHPIVSALHQPSPKVNTFGAAPQPQGGGGGEVNGSVGQNLMQATHGGRQFHGTLSDESQGGRINSLLSNQAGDAASIRAEKASNAPMEREHMAHTWADEDIQRHQEQQMRQLELERGKYQFHEAQKFPGSPLGPHWAALKEKIISDPMSYQSGKDASGKTVRGGLLPQHQQFVDYIDQQMRGLTEEGQPQPAQTPTASVAPAAATPPHKDAGAFSTFMSSALPPIAQGGLIGLAANAPGGWKYPAIGAASLTHRPLQALTDWATGGVTDEDRANHPDANKWGNIIGAAGEVGTLLQSGGAAKLRAQLTKRGYVPAGMGPRIAPQTATSKAGGAGNQFRSATEEAQKPLQTAAESANGPATAAGKTMAKMVKTPYAPKPIPRPMPGASGGVGDVTPPGQRGRGFPSAESMGVPPAITPQMQTGLKGLGLTPEQINKLTPQQAWELLVGATH